MREFIKVTSVLAFCASVMVCVFLWSDDRPASSTWTWRFVCPTIAVVAILIVLRIHFKRDLAPDFLSQKFKSFCDCNGFCFTPYMTVERGVCFINVAFQNRYERECVGRIRLRPAVAAFRSAVKVFGQRDFDPIDFEVACGPAAFGTATRPVAVKKEYAGKNLVLQIGAECQYPNGKGKMLRFRDGSPVRHNVEFESAFYGWMQALYLLGGGLLFASPGSCTFRLPGDAAESIPPEAGQLTQTLWTLDQGEVCSAVVSKPSERQ